jgi:signal transduction histidine kinase
VGEVTYDQDGKPVHMVGTVLDITERKQAEEALQHYTERLKTLRVIDQAILTAQSSEAIAQAALQHIRRLIPCQRASLTTIDLETQEATVLGVHINGETELETGTRFPLETLGNLQDLQQGQAQIVDNISSSSQPSSVQLTLYAESTRSYIIVPLTAQGDLIGTLNLGSEELAAFTSEHIDIAREVADQLAIAIQQARLHEQVQRYASELEQRIIHATAEISQRANELAVLYDVSRDMMTTLDLDTLLPTIAERVTEILSADRCTVFLFNEESELLQARAAYGYMAERMANFSYRPSEEIVGQVHATGTTQYMPDLDDVPDLPQRDAIRAVLAVPLMSATAGSLGALSVASLQPRAFTPNQQQLLETMASQITGAIENARLYRAAERHSMELAALYEVGKEITATLKLDSMLRTITDVAIRLVGADKSLILLVDTERERLTKIVGRGYSPTQLDGHTFREFQNGISGWVLREKASTLSVNIQTDERNQGKARISAQQSDDRSAAVAPLSIGDQVIGTLTVINSQRASTFTLADLNLITMLAGQATIAIQNAQLYEAAQEADRLKSAFLATMSHELRTPLNSIIGFTGIILQGLTGPLTNEQTKQLKMVQGSARHLLNLINDVLDISKIEAGQLETDAEPFDMKAAVEKAVQTVTPLAEKKGLAMVFEVAPEVGQITSDQRRVEQILINLLNNAIKFTQEGETRVTCQVNDDQIVTHVTDTGIGIKPEDIDKLFNPFQQIETGLTRRHEGTGLGLSISKKLVEMLGGEIWVESQWGAGSTFAFSLPIGRGEKDETQDTPH